MRSQKQKKVIIITGMLLFVGLMAFAMICLWEPLWRLAEEPALLRQWIDGWSWYGWILFTAIMGLQVFIAVIPGEALEIAAGYAFGAVEGTLLCMIGETIGGMLVFLFVGRFGVNAVETFFSIEKIQSLRFLRSPEKRDLLFFLLFLLPGTPKDLLCYFGGLTGIPAGTWFLIQSIGRLPSILTSTLSGNALGEEQYTKAILVLAITAICSAVGLLLYRYISLFENREHDKK